MHILNTFFAFFNDASCIHVILQYIHLVLDVGDATGGPLFLVVRPTGSSQNQAVTLNASLPLAPTQLEGGAMDHLLR
jgi:hypothetical protein